MKNAEGYELETYRVVWFVELGVCDGGGIGHWVETIESYRFKSEKEAKSFEHSLIDNGELKPIHWGELRPTKWTMGLYRIRRGLERVC